MVNIVVRSHVVENSSGKAMDSLSNEDVLEQKDGNEGVAVEKKTYEPGAGNVGRCKKSCAKKNYSKKRKYHPPKNPRKKKDPAVVEATEQQHDVEQQHRKIEDIPSKEPEENEKLNSYTLFHLRVLERLISGLLCPGWCGKDTLFIDTDNSKRKGLASYKIIKYKCGYINADYTSPVIVDDERQDKRGSKTFDINMKSVYAMRTCGLGHSALEKFCGMMNMPQPVAKPSYTALTKKLKKAAQITAETSMSAAANDAKEKEGTNDIGVSVDGTWQRRGYASLNGVVAAIYTANSKVVDVEIVLRCCKACQKFEEWKKDHEKDCQANYSGSAPGMETEGAIRIFGRSVQKHGAYYHITRSVLAIVFENCEQKQKVSVERIS